MNHKRSPQPRQRALKKKGEKKYCPPSLTKYGDLRKLTLSGGSVSPEIPTMQP